jgi:aspartate carbamoyltransferase catalytic subunit
VYIYSNSGSVTEENRFFMANVIRVCDFTRHDLHLLFSVAQEMKIIVEKHISVDILKGKVMCTAFYEPSTRTCVSFEAAMNRLGGSVVSINQITSSIAKGESVADTGILVMYTDFFSTYIGQLCRCDCHATPGTRFCWTSRRCIIGMFLC